MIIGPDLQNIIDRRDDHIAVLTQLNLEGKPSVAEAARADELTALIAEIQASNAKVMAQYDKQKAAGVQAND